jgi:hypothetical protein
MPRASASACSRVGLVLLYGDFEILSEQHILVRFFDGDATARVRETNQITNVESRVQAGSNRGPVRHSFAT